MFKQKLGYSEQIPIMRL